MKYILLFILIGIYSLFKGDIIEWIMKCKYKRRIYYAQIYETLSNELDKSVIIESIFVILFDSIMAYIVIGLFLYILAFEQIKRIIRKSDIELQNSIIHLMIESYYHLATGSRFDFFIKNIDNNSIVDYINKQSEPLNLRINKISQLIQKNSFNRYITLMQRTYIFDSASILYDLEMQIEMTLIDIYNEKKEYAEKLNELFVFPMALNLINMILMIVYPYLHEWI